MTFVICEPTLGAEPNDDRIGTILAYMVQMRDDMKLLNQKVDGVITKQGKIENQVIDVKDQIAAVKNQVSGVATQVIAVEKKVDKVDRDVHFGWTFIGEGIYKTCDVDHFYNNGVTLGECIEHCQKHREEYGREWNGLNFNTDIGHCSCQKNSRGIDTEGYSEWVLYRIA